MDLETFERCAFEFWESIPARFREGVTAVIVEPGTYRKEEFEDGWVYGYCEPDETMSAMPNAGVFAEAPRSVITLFYGSFVEIARLTPDFDWREELWETVRHELQHHLEWRAGVDHLGDEDDIQDENERRLMGAPFEVDYHRGGTPLGDGYLAAGVLYLEVVVPRRRWRALETESFEHRWGEIVAHTPPVSFDVSGEHVLYVDAEVEVLGGDAVIQLPWREVVVVFRRRRGWFW